MFDDILLLLYFTVPSQDVSSLFGKFFHSRRTQSVSSAFDVQYIMLWALPPTNIILFIIYYNAVRLSFGFFPG